MTRSAASVARNAARATGQATRNAVRQIASGQVLAPLEALQLLASACAKRNRLHDKTAVLCCCHFNPHCSCPGCVNYRTALAQAYRTIRRHGRSSVTGYWQEEPPTRCIA